jgi:hypothetical protein
LDKATELIKQAETIFLELKSPMAAKAKNDRERQERKQAEA